MIPKNIDHLAIHPHQIHQICIIKYDKYTKYTKTLFDAQDVKKIKHQVWSGYNTTHESIDRHLIFFFTLC